MIRLLLWAGTDPAAASVTIEPVGIPSAEAIGRPAISLRALQARRPFPGATFGVRLRLDKYETPPITIEPAGIPSAEAIGRPSIALRLGVLHLAAASIPTGSSFGRGVVELRRRPRAQREHELLIEWRRAA